MSDEAVIEPGTDRLPWLEAVDEDEDREGLGVGRLVGMILIGLLAIGLVVALLVWLQRDGGSQGQGELIAAPEEDYRVRPENPGGMEVEGEGDAAFATSEGASPQGRINPSAVPEEPVQGRRAPAAPAQQTASSSARIAPGSAAQPARPAAAPAAAAPPGTQIQLGAYSSEASANQAWTAMSGRYAYLGSLSRAVTPVHTGGRTLYRLRATAGSAADARSVCERLRVAQEACSVVAN